MFLACECCFRLTLFPTRKGVTYCTYTGGYINDIFITKERKTSQLKMTEPIDNIGITQCAQTSQ